MKITKKHYGISVKATMKYQSYTVTEGFEVEVDDDFDSFAFEEAKQELKDRVMVEAKEGVESLLEQPNVSTVSTSDIKINIEELEND